MNYVSVRIKNSYDKSFSISHNLKSKHKQIETKLKRYCKDREIDFNDLNTFEKYQIIRNQNKENYIINKDGTETIFRRDIGQELSLLKEYLKEISLYSKEKIKIEELIQKSEQELNLYNSYYNEINKKFKKEIKKVEEDYQKNNKRKLRNDSTINYGGIITFGNDNTDLSREEMDNQDQELLDAQRETTVKEIMKSLDIENNEYYLVKHVDEYQIHYHFEFIGYNYEKHSLVRRLLTQEKMIKFQDIAGVCFQNSDFHRGRPKWEKVQEYCDENDINYEELTAKRKYEILKEVKVKYESTKEYNQRLKNDIHRREEQQKQIELTITDIYEKISNKELTLEQVSQLKEQTKDKALKRFLNNCYKSINLDNEVESQEKALERVVRDFNKMDEDLKNAQFKIEVIETISEDFDKLVEEIKKQIENQQKLVNSQIKININTPKNQVKVNKVNLDFGKTEQTNQKLEENMENLKVLEEISKKLHKGKFAVTDKNIEIMKKILNTDFRHSYRAKMDLIRQLKTTEVPTIDLRNKDREKYSQAKKIQDKINQYKKSTGLEGLDDMVRGAKKDLDNMNSEKENRNKCSNYDRK